MPLDIEEIKAAGQVSGLKREIERRISLITNTIWQDYRSADYYILLKDRSGLNSKLLEEIAELLTALNELEPGNK